MLRLLQVGHCCHPEAMVMQGRRWKNMIFPAVVGLYKHPSKGYVLFDTGYAERFNHATMKLPERAYRFITPMSLLKEESLSSQLAKFSIAAEDIRYIFISHFHADHIAGLRDFPNATFIYSQQALSHYQSLGRVRALMKGFLPQLLPDNIATACCLIESCPQVILDGSLTPFIQGFDVFSDGSLIAISLPGHAAGHYGLLLESHNRPRFLIGDAAWTKNALTEGVRPSRLTHLIMDDGQAYLETLNKLSQLYFSNRTLQLLPSHCQQSFIDFQHEAEI